jgi:hypothetical protein
MSSAPTSNLADRAALLLEQQKAEWNLLRDGYVSLARVETRTFAFDGFEIHLHFNPGRLASSAAKVDAKSVAQRPCFLCPRNRPSEQRALELHDDLVLLCNPFPIFPEHFTIPTLTHQPQRIRPIFPLMLDVARELAPRYTVFYNGPRSGASAPDHLHLQAGNANSTPADREYAALPKTRLVATDHLRAFAVDRYLRRLVSLEGSDREQLVRAFDLAHATLETGEDEPMLNVFASYEGNEWRVTVYPRARHRPAAYFAEGDAKLLLSPGAVDMAGAVIMPVERDFRRVTKDDLVRMYEEVTIGADDFARLTEALRGSR